MNFDVMAEVWFLRLGSMRKFGRVITQNKWIYFAEVLSVRMCDTPFNNKNAA